jgi:hypothetical protein
VEVTHSRSENEGTSHILVAGQEIIHNSIKAELVSTPRIRTAGEVIDHAIAENKAGERLLYSLAVAFVTVGLSILIWAISQREAILAVVGVLTSSLFWPAMSSVRTTRRESVAIRLLEAPLSRADTAKEASEMLHHLFHEIFGDKQQDGTRVSQHK